MTNFWDRNLGPQPQAPSYAPQQPAQAPGPSQPWWAATPPQQPAQAPLAPQQYYQPQQPQHAPQYSPNGQYNIVELLRQQDYNTTKAKSAAYGRCPDCNSNNYMSVSAASPGDALMKAGDGMVQCYDCGSNTRFQQSTQGINIQATAGAPRVSRGQTLSTNNWNPRTIIGHA